MTCVLTSSHNAARKKRQIENKAAESTRKKRLNQLEQSEEDRLKATQSNFCRDTNNNSLFNEARVQRQLQERQAEEVRLREVRAMEIATQEEYDRQHTALHLTDVRDNHVSLFALMLFIHLLPMVIHM